jgi:hypothetical protein
MDTTCLPACSRAEIRRSVNIAMTSAFDVKWLVGAHVTNALIPPRAIGMSN